MAGFKMSETTVVPVGGSVAIGVPDYCCEVEPETNVIDELIAEKERDKRARKKEADNQAIINLIEQLELNWHLGEAVRIICKHPSSDADLKEAIRHVERHIESRKEKDND